MSEIDHKKAKESIEYFIDNCTDHKIYPWQRELIRMIDSGTSPVITIMPKRMGKTYFKVGREND